MESLEWMLRLVDQVTGPAKAVQKAMGGIQSQQKAMSGASGGFSMKSFEGLTESLGMVAAGFGEVAAAAALAAAPFAVGSGIAVAGGMWALDALSFKENTLTAFKTMLGSEEAASRVFAKINKFAADTPFETKDVVSMAQRFVTAGFKESDLEKLMLTAGDVGARFGADKMQSTISAIAKVKAKGKLGGEALDMLADAGVGTGAILDAIAKTRGLTRDQVQKLVSAGGISADEGVAAISQAVANTLSGGKLGQATLEAGKTVTGMLSTLASRPFDLFMKANAKGAFDGFKRLLQVVIDATDPEKAGGARFVAMFQKLSDAGKAFMDAISSDGMKTFINLASELLSSGIDMYLALMGGTMKGFGDVMKPAIEGIIKFTRDPAKMERLAQVIYGVSYAVGALFGVIGPNVEFTMKLLDQASMTFHTFFDPYLQAWTYVSTTFTQLRDYIAALMGINPSTATWETWIARILELVRGAMERVRSMIGGTLTLGGVGNVLAGAGGPLGLLGPGAPMTVLGGAATPANTQQNTKNFNASGMVIQVNATDPATGQSVGQRTGNAAAGALKEFFEGIAK